MQSLKNVVARTIIDMAAHQPTWTELRHALEVAIIIINDVDTYDALYERNSS